MANVPSPRQARSAEKPERKKQPKDPDWEAKREAILEKISQFLNDNYIGKPICVSCGPASYATPDAVKGARQRLEIAGWKVTRTFPDEGEVFFRIEGNDSTGEGDADGSAAVNEFA